MNGFDLTSFLYFGLALTILMIGNAASGAMKARKAGEFKFSVLLDGSTNYLLWLVSILCATAGFQIYGGDLTITVGEESYTLLQAINIAQKTVYIFWGGKLIQNILEYAKIDKKIDEVEDPNLLYDRIVQNELQIVEGKG